MLHQKWDSVKFLGYIKIASSSPSGHETGIASANSLVRISVIATQYCAETAENLLIV